MAGAGIGIGIHRHRANAEPAGGGGNAAGDFAAIGDQDLVEHGLKLGSGRRVRINQST